MADINFPNNPIHGQDFYFAGNDVTYTYILDGANGFWTALAPGSYGPAVGLDVDEGTDTFKFVTSKAIEDSGVFKAISIRANNGAASNVLNDQDLTLENGAGITVSKKTTGWKSDLNTADGSNLGGIVLKDTTDTSWNEDAGFAATPKSVKDVSNSLTLKCKLSGSGLNGRNAEWDFSGQFTGIPLQIKMGVTTWVDGSGDGLGGLQEIVFDTDFNTSCLGVWLTVIATGTHVGQHKGGPHGEICYVYRAPTATSFKWILDEEADPHEDFDLNWVAIGY